MEEEEDERGMKRGKEGESDQAQGATVGGRRENRGGGWPMRFPAACTWESVVRYVAREWIAVKRRRRRE